MNPSRDWVTVVPVQVSLKTCNIWDLGHVAQSVPPYQGEATERRDNIK